MNSFLLNRALGNISASSFAQAQTTRLIYAIQAAPPGAVVFDGSTTSIQQSPIQSSSIQPASRSSNSRVEPDRIVPARGSAQTPHTSRTDDARRDDGQDVATRTCAHYAGVNDLVVEKFEGRLCVESFVSVHQYSFFWRCGGLWFLLHVLGNILKRTLLSSSLVSIYNPKNASVFSGKSIEIWKHCPCSVLGFQISSSPIVFFPAWIFILEIFHVLD